MTSKNSCAAVYNSHEDAEQAIKELQKAGFDMKKLSIVGKGYHSDEHVAGYYTTGDRVKFWGKWGAFWGGIFGLLFGSAFFWIPGLGAVAVAGPLVASLVGALEGATLYGGLSAIGAALYSIGIPKDSIIKYETALKADKFLLVVHGTREEVEKANDILKTNTGAEVAVHAG